MKKLVFFVLLLSSLAFLYCLTGTKETANTGHQTIQADRLPDLSNQNNNEDAQAFPDFNESIQQPLQQDGTRATNSTVASVSGNWSDTATWGGAPVPTSSEAVTINAGITVTVDIPAACYSITFAAVTASSAITISGTNSLAVTTTVSMPRPDTGFFCTINVNAGTCTIGTTLTMSGTLIAAGTRTDNINVTTGSFSIGGNVTSGTTGCIFAISGTGSMNFGGTFSSTPTMTLATTSTVNYTGALAQTIAPGTYGILNLSGAGTKTLAASKTMTVNGTLTNSSNFVLTAGTSTTSTWLVLVGNLTNAGTISAIGSYTRFIFNSPYAQTFTNNGTISSPMTSFDVSNTSALGLTIAGSNGFVVSRANLFAGVVSNSGMITLGDGGTTSAIVQRGVSSATTPAGSFAVAPNFNVGSGGLRLLYDNGSVAYSTGYEVPSSNTAMIFYLFDAADVTLSSDLTVTSELRFSGGTGVAALRIGTHTLTLNGVITYNAAGSFNGGASSNLIMNGSTTLNAITGGLNNLTINNAGNVALGGAVTIYGTLTLTNGRLVNSSYLTMATGATISRDAGGLNAAPIFAGTVNLIYTAAHAMNTGYELPLNSTVLNNLTTNAGGVTQSGTPTGSVSTIYTQGFNAAPADWATEIVTNPAGNAPTITYVTAATSTNPTVTPSEGTNCVQFNSYTCEAGDQIRLKMVSSPLVTTGKINIAITFDWYMDSGYNNDDNVVVQWSTNGTAWNSTNKYYRYRATNGWVINSFYLPAGAENQATLYIAFLFTGAYGNNCHLDNMKIDAITLGVPISTTATINGVLNLVGNYTIGDGNTLTINGNVNHSGGSIIGNVNGNVNVGSTGTIELPAIINTLTLDNSGVVMLPNDVTVGVLTITSGILNLNGNSLTFSGAPNLTFTGAGIVTSLSAAEATDPLLPAKINRQWLVSGGITSELHATFTWTALDDGDFNWTGNAPVVFQGTTRLTTISSALRSVTVAIASLSKAPFTIGFENGGDLPVELSSFTALVSAQMFVNLQWTTESETNNQGFNVLRSNDGILANAVQVNVGMITGTNTTTTHNYSFVDHEIEAQNAYYYWLEMVNFDGTSNFSNYVMVNTTNTAPVIPTTTMLKNAYPNPFNSNHSTTIGLDVKNGETATLTIYNVRGQIVKTYSKEAGSHQISWNGLDENGTACGSGIYFYKLSTESMNITKKMMIVK